MSLFEILKCEQREPILIILLFRLISDKLLIVLKSTKSLGAINLCFIDAINVIPPAKNLGSSHELYIFIASSIFFGE
jgi:hypothetical protein